MLIRNAECLHFESHNLSITHQDVRIKGGIVSEMGDLTPGCDDQVLDLAGASLLPSLHDHHVHLASYAASLNSVVCGPPVVNSANELIEQLNGAPGSDDWLRGINYHEGVAGEIDRHWLDKHAPGRPIRIQHRSGRLWILNSAALSLLESIQPPIVSGSAQDLDKGHLYDRDKALVPLTSGTGLPIETASRNLASFGVTAVNDMTPSNDLSTYEWFEALQAQGALLQKLRLSGTIELSARMPDATSGLSIGEYKIHLHDSDLPDFYELARSVATSHNEHRTVAIHCVTELELVFALAVLGECGVIPGDRIEHASVMPDALVTQVRESGLQVVTQPNFILERGDAYVTDLPDREHASLYRCQSLLEASIPLAFGTDLPFGHADPWVAIRSATDRQTTAGHILGADERMTPEAALACFLGELNKPTVSRTITVGATADLCLLDCPWAVARGRLSSERVRATMRDGELIYQNIPA